MIHRSAITKQILHTALVTTTSVSNGLTLLHITGEMKVARSKGPRGNILNPINQ
jgi:hypothetical protein